jgi:hypothetical protein
MSKTYGQLASSAPYSPEQLACSYSVIYETISYAMLQKTYKFQVISFRYVLTSKVRIYLGLAESPRLEKHPFLAAHYCLFNICAQGGLFFKPKSNSLINFTFF